MGHSNLDDAASPTTASGLVRASADGIAALRTATAAFAELSDELAEERVRSRELAERLVDAHQAAERERRRADTLFSSIKLLHRSLYAGNTAEHILRASMDVTDAERGYYLAAEEDGLRIRATAAMNGEGMSPVRAAGARDQRATAVDRG
jgi:hypothetical protein